MAECVLSLIVAETVQRSTNQEKQGYETGYRFVEQMSERRLGTDPLEVMKFLCKELWFDTVWKSTSVSGAPDKSSLSHFSSMTLPCRTPSSRRRVDGVEDDAAIRKRRKFDFTQTQTAFMQDVRPSMASAAKKWAIFVALACTRTVVA